MTVDFTELIVRAVIRRDGHLLLARQRNTPWSFLPGGHVEPGEPVETALLRELAEELGADAKITGFLGVVEHGYVENGPAHHEINLVFEAEIGNATPVSQEDHLECHWLSIAEIANADIRPSSIKNAIATSADTPFWRPWRR